MKTWVCRLRLLLGLLLIQTALAQPSPVGWQGDPHLRGLALRTLVQAPNGLLWLGTDDGVLRYDGTDLVPLNALRRSGPLLPTAACTQLLALPNGDLWLGTEAGAYRFTAAGTLHPVVLPGRTRRVVSRLAQAADGRVWLAQERTGVQAYTPDGRPIGPLLHVPDPNLGIWPAPDGSLWLYTGGGRTEHRTASGQLLHQWHHPGRYLQPVANAQGHIWLLSTRAAYRPQPQGSLVEISRWRPPGPEELFDATRTDTTCTLLVWDQLVQVGWARTTVPQAQFTVAPLPLSPSKWGGRITTDASGHWWLFNTGIRGAWRRLATPPFIRPIPRFDGRGYSVRAIARLPDSRLLVSTYDGVLVQAAHAPLAPLRPLPTTVLPDGQLPVLVSILPTRLGPSGEWVTGCAGPFLALNPHTGHVRALPTLGLVDNAPDVRCLARDPATGRIWGGTVAGLYVLDSVAQQFGPYRPAGTPLTTRPPLADRTIEDLWADGRGHLWLATPEGVERLTLATGARRRYGPTAAAGRRAPVDGARCLHGDAAGRVWVGTRTHGLLVVEPDGRARSVLTTAQGLPSAAVVTITPGPGGTLWLGTYQGVVRFTPASNAWALFTTVDGLASDECNARAAMVDYDGTLLIGGVAGLHRLYPTQAPATRRQRQLPLRLTARTVLGVSAQQSYTAYQLAADSLPHLRLSPAQPVVDLHLTLGGELNTDGARYFYRIADWLGGRWLPLGSTSRLRLQGLPAGTYDVEIRGESSRGVAAANRLQLPLTVTTDWWRRPTTWAAAVLLTLLLLYVWQRQRQRRHQQDALRRAQLAADLHDEVGALLTRVTLQADLLQHLPPAAVPARLAALRGHSQQAAATVRDIIWSVSPEADTLAGLLARMRDVLDHAAHDAPLTVELHPNNWPADKQQPVPPEVRQHVYLVFKEAVTNVLRHAPGATRLDVTLCYLRPGQLALTVRNDGPTVAASTARASQGLRNMQQRAAELGWQLTAGPVAGGGWQVHLAP